MTEKELQIIESIWGSSASRVSKASGLEHEYRFFNLNKSVKDSRAMPTVKTKKRVS